MTASIALQLYTVRELMAKDFEGTVRKVAEIGYPGVEVSEFAGRDSVEVGKFLDGLGLRVAGVHGPLPLGGDANRVLDTAAAFGCTRLVSGKGPDDVKTMDLIKRTCDEINAAMPFVRQHGLSLSLHNHWWEFEEIDGRRVCQVMLDCLDKDVLFEVDVYWAQTGGANPAAALKELGPRAKLLHIKDGPCKKGVPMTAVGEGMVDMPAVLEAAQAHAEWLIVELDECATDMMEAVAKSYRYLAAR
ncbi:MAG: hypothetical protein QG656_506 [Candidatus Hydrogenedentes bacterium]|nr:hypothetical protein [Candidatus Hydrogenedentota bacterium]